jgi:hypothetical protein
MSKGWRNESARHSLASRGLKTKVPRKSVTGPQLKAYEKLQYDIAVKVGRGREKLTRVEFKLAKDFGYFSPQLTYEMLDAMWYEGGTTKGYLMVKDGKIVSKKSEPKIDPKTGKKFYTISVLGWLHREEIAPQHLTKKQKHLW